MSEVGSGHGKTSEYTNRAAVGPAAAVDSDSKLGRRCQRRVNFDPSVGDRMGAKLLVIVLLNTCTRLKLIWADSGYDGQLLTAWMYSVARITLEVIKRTELHTFRVVPGRWVVERSFGWLLRYRRLVRDYERRPEHHEAMVYRATVITMTRRLAHRSTDRPLERRWGTPRTASTPHPTPT
jgi:transposase